jgi:putative transcriptional regulator
MTDRDYLTGKLLIAMPNMGDSRFAHTVVFMCDHSDDHAMGIVINRPSEKITFDKLLRELEIEPVEGVTLDQPVLAGGPVEPQRGFVLHSDDFNAASGTLNVHKGGISLTATHEVLQAIAKGRGPSRALIALGYAGWGAGQLESELQANAWLHCEAEPDLLFSRNHDDKWHRALAHLGINDAMFSQEWASVREEGAQLH